MTSIWAELSSPSYFEIAVPNDPGRSSPPDAKGEVTVSIAKFSLGAVYIHAYIHFTWQLISHFKVILEFRIMPSDGLTLEVRPQKQQFYRELDPRPPADSLSLEKPPPKAPLRTPLSWLPWPWFALKEVKMARKVSGGKKKTKLWIFYIFYRLLTSNQALPVSSWLHH